MGTADFAPAAMVVNQGWLQEQVWFVAAADVLHLVHARTSYTERPDLSVFLIIVTCVLGAVVLARQRTTITECAPHLHTI